jgi:hypothetical protein
MRNYFYNMVLKESSGDPSQGSTTGAKGLLQFTRGTGKMYGLVGKDSDIRNDPVANIQAGVRLTQDNWNTLKKRLGRDPSHSELALAHQQGADTAANMLLGTKNASPTNLAVNGVSPIASPQAAARQIMNYYGFDKQPRPPMGMSLAYNPMLPQLQQPMPTAQPPIATQPADPAMLAQSPAAAPAAPPSPLDDIKSKLLGPKGDGGEGSGLEALKEVASGLQPKATGPAAGEAARAAATISPMSPDTQSAGIAGSASSLLAAMLNNRRKQYGLSLTSGSP